ncbi:jg17235 [Pararge aegeria aegeria]|uniref:Jg17235 protein n=1 Tax=Pararge aegeria aegeria TaxID=348720 RepID=A0A8S4QV19_9NEOP|nr:jg17235 [Pararge aegeria aegeria]
MRTALFTFSTLLLLIEAKITIDVKAGREITDTTISYSGYSKDVVSEKDINLFNINQINLKRAVRNHYGAIPKDVYLKSPTPWGDLYKKNNWDQVSRILTVKSAIIKEGSFKSVLILAQDFDNNSNKTIKVNAGISQSVENTLTTSWSSSKDVTISQEIEYDLNVIFAKVSGTTSFSYTSSWGKSEEKSESVTIGTNTGVEIELNPHQSATAVLSANRCSLEILVEYIVTLRGNVAINFKKKHEGHHFYGPSINSVMKSGGLETQKSFHETVRIGVFTDASLSVTDKISGLPL